MRDSILQNALRVLACAALCCSEAAGGDAPRKVVFLRDGQVWTAGADGSQLRQLTSDAAHKSWPAWSPDGSRIVYDYVRGDGSEGDFGLIIISERGEPLESVHFDCASVDRLDWLDAGRMGIECHVRPYLAEYFVLDTRTWKAMQRFTGYRFRCSPDRTKVAHLGAVVPTPVPKPGSATLQINETTVYSPQKAKQAHSFTRFVWSPDTRGIAFANRDEASGSQTLVLVRDGKVETTWRLTGALAGARPVAWLDAGNVVLSNAEQRFWKFSRQAQRAAPLAKASTRQQREQEERRREREALLEKLRGNSADWWPAE